MAVIPKSLAVDRQRLRTWSAAYRSPTRLLARHRIGDIGIVAFFRPIDIGTGSRQRCRLSGNMPPVRDPARGNDARAVIGVRKLEQAGGMGRGQ